MLYNIHELRWDPWLLDLFGIPESLLPEVLPSSGEFGRTASAGIVPNVPICGVAGDQQAALFGQCCFQPGQAKNTSVSYTHLVRLAGDGSLASLAAAPRRRRRAGEPAVLGVRLHRVVPPRAARVLPGELRVRRMHGHHADQRDRVVLERLPGCLLYTSRCV